VAALMTQTRSPGYAISSIPNALAAKEREYCA